MTPDDESSTPAIEAVAATGIPHRVVRTRRARSVEEAAELRAVPVRALLKTLVVRRADDAYVFVLVPGDRVIDWPKLRAYLGVRRLSLPDADDARRVTGYERGAITPFGATHAWPVVADAAITHERAVSIGGGAHGVSITLNAGDLVAVLAAAVVDVSAPA